MLLSSLPVPSLPGWRLRARFNSSLVPGISSASHPWGFADPLCLFHRAAPLCRAGPGSLRTLGRKAPAALVAGLGLQVIQNGANCPSCRRSPLQGVLDPLFQLGLEWNADLSANRRCSVILSQGQICLSPHSCKQTPNGTNLIKTKLKRRWFCVREQHSHHHLISNTKACLNALSWASEQPPRMLKRATSFIASLLIGLGRSSLLSASLSHQNS